jgi:urea transport system permease protein
VASKLGKVLIAIRDAEARVRFLGYRVEAYKLFVFTLSACMAGIAGALYVPQVGIINPSEFSPANSIEAVIWVAVGGRGTLTGAALGAVVVNYAKTYFTSGVLAPYWLFILGGLFIAVTLLLPQGIVGTARHFMAERRQRTLAASKSAHNATAAMPEPVPKSPDVSRFEHIGNGPAKPEPGQRAADVRRVEHIGNGSAIPEPAPRPAE